MKSLLSTQRRREREDKSEKWYTDTSAREECETKQSAAEVLGREEKRESKEATVQTGRTELSDSF